MCFSARMSFLAVGLLVSIAIATYSKVKNRTQLLLASIPILFALQQLAEGVLWILLPKQHYPGLIALTKYTFLSIAFIVWPVFVPLSVLLLETQLIRRMIIASCLVLGIGWSFASLWYLVNVGATAEIRSCHIYYELADTPTVDTIRILLYCMATLVPFLASSSFSLRLLGSLLGLSCLISYVVWYQFFVSVWCFFVALLSLAIYKIISDQEFASLD